ncbi:MAG: hypothetical protein WBV78_12070, partial [Roseobacter sp.]
TDVVALGDKTEEGVLSYAAALERGSEHPLAEAILKGAEERRAEQLDLADFSAVTGKGVRGRIDETEVALGNTALMEDLGVDISAVCPSSYKMGHQSGLSNGGSGSFA